MNHLSDEELMSRCARMDRRAMDVLVSRYHGKLLDFAFRHLWDREAAADIAQSALVRAFERAGRFQSRASFKTWLYTIALNLVRDECRRRRVRKESLESELEAGGAISRIATEHTNPCPSPEDAVMSRMSASFIWKAVGGLSENHRSAILLKFRDGFTYEEIAEVMNAPAGTVKSWIHFGLKELRKSLEPVGCED